MVIFAAAVIVADCGIGGSGVVAIIGLVFWLQCQRQLQFTAAGTRVYATAIVAAAAVAAVGASGSALRNC